MVLAISGAIFAFELAGGILSQSLALVSDSLHVLLDFSALGISLAAFRIAKRPHSATLSYGFHRVEILAALLNGASLVGISIFIFYEAYQRLLHPNTVNTPLLLVFASIGLAANIGMVLLLKKEKSHNLNIKGSYIHVLGDLLSSAAVIGGAIIMGLTANYAVDVIVSVGIGILIIRSGILLCRECLHIFLEGTPSEIDTEKIVAALQDFDEVNEVHDLHVWSLTSNLFVMSAHVRVGESLDDTNLLLQKMHRMMRDEFGINHCTIQIEKGHGLISPDRK